MWGKLGNDGDNERFHLWSDFWQLNPDDPSTPHGDEERSDLPTDDVDRRRSASGWPGR